MRSMKAMLVALVAALIGIAAYAQSPNPLAPVTGKEAARDDSRQPVAAPAGGARPLEPTDVNAFLDGFLPYALSEGDIAGAVVVVVRDGQVIAQRGYGYADVASRKPVDPERTLFRPGSVSKLFTWTAVMQQVEQGKIDLDADINQYLDFRIPPFDGKPVTMRQLMTHTGGFEEQLKDLIGNNRANVPPYDQLLKRWVPTRIFAPGTTPAYSNYGTSLAGYIVERVSGEPFNAYVERHIFAPLGMQHSSFAQPLPDRLKPLMATGYGRASGEVIPFEIVGPEPAGSLSSTGADMGRFMLAHLNGGELDGQRILRPETARMMHTTALDMIPPLDRMLLGFFETDINGREVIAHLGDTGAFHTSLHLFLDERTGLYASFSSDGDQGAVNGVRINLFEQFADRYFPAPRDTRRVPEDVSRQHAQMMAGNWISSRRAETNFLSLTQLIGQTSVGVGPEGKLVTPPGLSLTGWPTNWVEVAPFVWQDQNSHTRLAAVVKDGVVQRFSISILSAFTVFERAPWYKNAALLMPLLYFSLAALLLTAIVWPGAALVRRKYGAKLALEGTPLRVYRLTKITAIAVLLVLIGWIVAVSMMFADLDNLGGALDPLVLTLQVLTFLVFVGGLGIALWNLWTVWRGKRRWPAKVWSIVLVIALITMVWIGLAFHLIGFNVNY